jgi:CRISPR-associated protein Cas1
MEYNVNVVLCNLEHAPCSLIIPQVGNKQSTQVLFKQMAWTDGIKRRLHQEIVRFKIQNQLELLKYRRSDPLAVSRLEEYQQQVEPGDATNREGLAAKVYFRALFGPTFRRFEADTVNGALNYGYAILRSQISKTIVAKGLHPALGFFHIGPTNAFNLSDDIIEVFRPLVDAHVVMHCMDLDMLGKEEKTELIRLTTSDLMYKDKRQTLFNVMTSFIDDIVRFTETGDLGCLDRPRIRFHEL